MAVFDFLHLTRFHLYMCVIWQIGIYWAAQQIFGIFANYTPEWRCEESNFKTDWSKNCSIFESCSSENLTLREAPFYSAVEEFLMLCGKDAYFVSVISTVQFIGVLIGTITLGHLGDRFGRKKVTCGSIILGISVASASGASVNWQMMAVLRFLVGFSVGGVIVVGFAFVVEHLLPQQRLFLRCFFNWGSARLLFTTLCYLVPHWRYAAVVTVLPMVIMLIMVWISPESPKWFQSRNRHKEAIESLKKAAKFNGKEYSEASSLHQNDSTTVQHTYTMKDLFSTKQLTIRTLTLCFMWFTGGISTYTLDLNSRNLVGDFYLNQFLMSVLIMLSKFALFFMDTYIPGFSRRLLHQLPQLLVCICYAIIMMLIIFEANPLIVTIMNIFGIVLVEYTWDACYLCAAEGFPTVVRSIGVGTCSLMARGGAALGPQMTYLFNIWKGAPFAAVAVCGLISLFLSYFFLPETKNRELEDLLPSKTDSDVKETVAL